MANAERELADNAEWKRIQQNTFTRDDKHFFISMALKPINVRWMIRTGFQLW